ncbi:hypothetical protein [Azomonas macrocytogenes]|uniref:Uncharacterized protein n=1 Tax=Azomonas macrocytogenes TaxID=69962 RepID=A0A839T3X1_AZOMA|nr:hypothetical protein [Azomonas macrocytogenes]MBB3103699.1 hypothetical protein [Azomonas macrocytogenes]
MIKAQQMPYDVQPNPFDDPEIGLGSDVGYETPHDDSDVAAEDQDDYRSPSKKVASYKFWKKEANAGESPLG